MKESTKDAVINALDYLLMAIIAISILCWVFWLGEFKGMTEAYKTELKKQIEMLEEEKQEAMKESTKDTRYDTDQEPDYQGATQRPEPAEK